MRSRASVILFLYASMLAPLLAAQTRLQVVRAVDETGHATSLWQQMIAKRLPEERFRELEPLFKPYTAAESAWVHLIEAREPEWRKLVGDLAVPFHPLQAPDAQIVLGNRGGEDAFTHDPHTIGFDVERLNSLYGDAGKNSDLIDRLFRHEYTHLLQKAWLQDHPLATDTPLHTALAEMWTEGMGNYYSLSDQWKPTGNAPSAKASEALTRLEPIWLARMAALACASPATADKVRKGLSSGSFDHKWGALPVALWLESEPDPNAIRDFITGGEDAVWSLAERHLPSHLLPQLDQIRELEKACKIEE